MSDARREPHHTGGCQCGAVRYAVYAEPHDPHICHCRMCQKAFGSFFAPLFAIKLADFAWTRGAPTLFDSSTIAQRSFCRDCGTPLTFQFVDSDVIDLSIGSLDDPAKVVPAQQYGIESRMLWFDRLHALPGSRTEEGMPAERLAALKSHQHPDG